MQINAIMKKIVLMAALASQRYHQYASDSAEQAKYEVGRGETGLVRNGLFVNKTGGAQPAPHFHFEKLEIVFCIVRHSSVRGATGSVKTMTARGIPLFHLYLFHVFDSPMTFH